MAIRDRKPVVIGENSNIYVKQVDRLSNYDAQETIFHKELPDARGQFMMNLIERFGVIAATRGPEDSNGRATMELLPEIDVVNRAAAITAMAFEEIERRGWMVKLTRPADLDD